jgi:hypothetical protein
MQTEIAIAGNARRIYKKRLHSLGANVPDEPYARLNSARRVQVPILRKIAYLN